MKKEPNPNDVSLRAVARRLDISIMTLYRVLNNVPTVKPATCRRVASDF